MIGKIKDLIHIPAVLYYASQYGYTTHLTYSLIKYIVPAQNIFIKMINRHRAGAFYLSVIFTSVILIILNIRDFISSEHKNAQILSDNNSENKKQFLTPVTLWQRTKNRHITAPTDNIDSTQRPTQKNLTLSGIVISDHSAHSFVLVNEDGKQSKYRLNDALDSNPQTFIRKIDKTSVVFETHGQFEKVTLLPELALSDPRTQSTTGAQPALADFIIATPIREGEKIHGLRLYPKPESKTFTNTLLQSGDVAIRLNNISLTTQDGISQALSALLTQQSAQFTVRRNGVPRLINVSTNDLLKKNGQSDEGTE